MKKEPYNLFIDDQRLPNEVDYIKYPKDIYWHIVCKNYESFVETIKQYGVPEYLSADHDICPEHYIEFHRAWNGDRTLNYDNMGGNTGYDCIKFLIDYCIMYNLPLPRIFVHTMNQIGKENIENLIKNLKK